MRQQASSARRGAKPSRRAVAVLLGMMALACAGPGAPPAGTNTPRGETGRLRRIDVAVSPLDAGTVSDSIDGSAVDACSECRQRYRVGTEVVFTARAAPDFVFDRWLGGGCDGSSAPNCRFTVADSGRLTAVFRFGHAQ